MQQKDMYGKSFFESEKYKAKFEELFMRGEMHLLMICNDIVIRINHANQRYHEYCALRDEYAKLNADEQTIFSANSNEAMLAEEIVYHTRKAIDEMIYSLWIHKVGIANIDDNSLTKIDSIGSYRCHKSNNGQMDEFDAYADYLDSVNQVSNSYKHSLGLFSHLSTDLAQEEPQFLTYVVRNSNKEKDAGISQSKMLLQLEELFEFFLTLI